MSEEIKDTNTEEVTNTESTSANSSTEDVKNDQQADKTIPYSRFKEVNDNYKSLKDKLEEIENQKATDDLEAKKKAGEYKELYDSLQDEHEPLKNQVSEYKQFFSDLLESKLATVPDDFKELIPENLSDTAKLKWIENASSKGLFNKVTAESFGNKGANPSTESPVKQTAYIKGLSRKF
ncbi:hypothetical protein [Jeotgalibacillus malaysiensis]|uniref:hypothetical protein n=1 Tax=Jeotgalibacillus malaysiensis TaxID=1508404 RepID=UPI00384D4C65